MSFFEDELKRLAPGISDGCVSVLEKNYGTCTGFHTGLDVMAKILNSGQPAKQTPAFNTPWLEIYADTIQIYQAKGCLIMEAFDTALMMDSRPTLPLHDAISYRINTITTQTSKGADKTSTDYISALSMLGFEVKKNLAGNHTEVNGQPISDGIESTIMWLMKDAGFKGRENISNTIKMTAEMNKYHPVQEYLEGLVWDGVPRIQKLSTYFDAVNKALFPVIFRKWLIGAVDRVFTQAQNPMLVLDGPQGCGKSYFVRWLCPLPKFFREGPIDPTSTDDKIAASENWVWEVAELGSTTRKADREALKSFLTTKAFSVRASYAHYNEQYAMMASFLGTINDEAGFLDDPTGSRRFWVAKLDGINKNYSEDLDPEQVWAEAYAAWKAGESHELDEDEYNTMQRITEEYRIISATEEALKKCFQIDPEDPYLQANFVPFTDIRAALADPTRGGLSGQDITDRKIAAALKSLGLKDTRRSISLKPGITSKKQVRGYTGLEPI